MGLYFSPPPPRIRLLSEPFMRHPGSVSYSTPVQQTPFPSPHLLRRTLVSTNLFIDACFHIPITATRRGIQSRTLRADKIRAYSQVSQSVRLRANARVSYKTTINKFMDGNTILIRYSIRKWPSASHFSLFVLLWLNPRPWLLTAQINIKGTH